MKRGVACVCEHRLCRPSAPGGFGGYYEPRRPRKTRKAKPWKFDGHQIAPKQPIHSAERAKPKNSVRHASRSLASSQRDSSSTGVWKNGVQARVQ